MAVLHVTKPGAKIRVRKGRFIVEKEGEVLATAPKNQVERIVLHGNVGVTTPALVFCMRRKIPIYFVSSGGRIYGKALGEYYTAADKLRAQVLLDENRKLALAKLILRGKLTSQMAYATLRNARARCGLETESQLATLRASLEQVAEANSLAELRGIEGTAAAAYFAGLACGWASYGFLARKRRPPRDPVNAALSYAYAVLQGVVEAAVLAAGLHPEFGLLHSTTRRNPALVFDLMEEFRVPVVDRVVGRLFGLGQLKPERHFGGGSQKTLLNKAGRVVLMEGLERQLRSLRRHPLTGVEASLLEHIYKQAENIEAAIVRDRPYKPFWVDDR
ncbi:CRISPR-associated endonuclease Cas1 [Oceanithermus sp.]